MKWAANSNGLYEILKILDDRWSDLDSMPFCQPNYTSICIYCDYHGNNFSFCLFCHITDTVFISKVADNA